MHHLLRRGRLPGVAVLAWAVLAGPVALLGPWAEAGTTTGTGVTIGGLDNLAITVDTYSKGNVGKMIGIGLGLVGMMLLGAGRGGMGALAALGGIGAAFIPNIMGTAFDATTAAPLEGLVPVATGPAAWWEPVLGMLYLPLLAVHFVQDPVFWVALGLVLLGGSWATTRQGRIALARA